MEDSMSKTMIQKRSHPTASQYSNTATTYAFIQEEQDYKRRKLADSWGSPLSQFLGTPLSAEPAYQNPPKDNNSSLL